MQKSNQIYIQVDPFQKCREDSSFLLRLSLSQSLACVQCCVFKFLMPTSFTYQVHISIFGVNSVYFFVLWENAVTFGHLTCDIIPYFYFLRYFTQNQTRTSVATRGACFFSHRSRHNSSALV